MVHTYSFERNNYKFSVYFNGDTFKLYAHPFRTNDDYFMQEGKYLLDLVNYADNCSRDRKTMDLYVRLQDRLDMIEAPKR